MWPDRAKVGHLDVNFVEIDAFVALLTVNQTENNQEVSLSETVTHFNGHSALTHFNPFLTFHWSLRDGFHKTIIPQKNAIEVRLT